MSGSRKALIVANDTYDHEGLNHLLAPQADAEALAGVLGDAAIGDFDVRVVRNEPAHVIREEIEDLFSDSRPDDVLLLHFSCHGLKGDSGELFFATRNTRPNRLGSTAVSADFVQRCMRASRSRSIVLLLDCCYGGAFSTGVKVRAAGDVNVFDSFHGGGRGRAVITASSAMEYAFEGDQLADSDELSRRPSVFTSALVEGLATGDADRDQDGWVSLNELYDYVFDRVRERNPHQTPSRDVEMQGELYVARRSRPVTSAAPLPPELQSVIDHPIGSIRAGAVTELARLAHGRHAGMAIAAREALEHLANDDSRTVAGAAAAALAGDLSDTDPPALAPAGDTPGDMPAAAPVAAPAPDRRRWIYAGAAAAVVVAGAVFALTQFGDDNDGASPPAVMTSAQSFTAQSPWRLTIKDNAQGNDPGCDVTVQRVGAAQPLAVPTDVYLPVTVQVRDSGEFRWTANDPGCLTQPRPGAGEVKLPFVPEVLGDTDVFPASGLVTVEALDDHGNNSCDYELHDASDGRTLDTKVQEKGAGPVQLDPLGATNVYLSSRYCNVRIR
ncbi:caspase family protein [Actinoplanes bogorensis]|uniref:Caspase family protein n=1 Tax=Paractinoplanes bogorensis TaxID=1610840 RepID=A0ABS5YIT4_9ACTN|nr:caspase family protein [Actinoplanes bogorensis]MBU2662629.1 caspase family protein [Actinoplanes bogorensis]